jgi:hypothetical protein
MGRVFQAYVHYVEGAWLQDRQLLYLLLLSDVWFCRLPLDSEPYTDNSGAFLRRPSVALHTDKKEKEISSCTRIFR